MRCRCSSPTSWRCCRKGVPVPAGNAALIAAGTGLGEALLHNVDGRFRAVGVRGRPRRLRRAHAARAGARARADADSRTRGRRARDLRPGPRESVPLHARHAATCDAPAAWSAGDVDAAELPAAITRPRPSPADASSAPKRSRCSWRPTAPKPATSRCARWPPPASTSAAASRRKSCPPSRAACSWTAFRDKDPMTDLLRTLPVTVILNPAAGLLGAAVRAGLY